MILIPCSQLERRAVRINPLSLYFVAVYSQLPCSQTVKDVSFSGHNFGAYRRVYPGYHTTCYDKASVSVFGIELFPEIMHSKFPGVQCPIHVDFDNF